LEEKWVALRGLPTVGGGRERKGRERFRICS
jgi:hypothetical protein